MKEFFLESRGIYYRKNEFAHDRNTLVFVHGVSASSSAWIKYEERFQLEYNILSFDLRGHGKSLKYKKYEDYQLQNFAIDIVELLKELDVNNIILISHSFGTLVALEFLAEHQNMTQKAIFLSPVLDEKKILGIFLKPILKIVTLLNKIYFSQKPAHHVNYSMYSHSKEWSPSRLFADVKNTGLRVYLFCIGQMCTFDREKLLENVNVPSLIIHGKNDTYSSVDNAVYMVSKISNSELIILENADHIIVLNNFDEVSGIIEKFINK